jgi:hypothetical protein
MAKPIPAGLRNKFVSFMDAHDIEDLPDGAWFANLEAAAQKFMDTHGLTQKWMCNNDATFQYLEIKEKLR